MKILRILILEDDLETVYKLVECLNSLQKTLNLDIGTTVLSDYYQVNDYLNKAEKNVFDVILLDRDCFSGGSFHVLDFSKYPIEKIIGISSTPPYNAELKEKGVSRLVHKDYQNLNRFIEEVRGNIKDLLQL